MIIIGAGLSGLLCGALNPGSVIYEAGPDRPSDHKAVLRCKTNEISRLTGIPFKEVVVHKAIWFKGEEVQPTPRFAHMYSKKVTGTISARSIFNIESGTRFIPPPDFVSQLKSRCKIVYDTRVSKVDGLDAFDNPIVSTIPMPMLQQILGPPEYRILPDDFKSTPIVVNQFEIPDCDSYTTIYFPDPSNPIYRATLNGSTLIVESTEVPEEIHLDDVFYSLGIIEVDEEPTVQNHIQKFGKITPIDHKARKKFIYDMTVEHGIYSLGRFATWRPKVVLDDVLEDIFVIRRLIEGSNYAAMNHNQGEK